MIPTRRLFTILGGLAIFGAVAGLWPMLLPAWTGTFVALLAVVAFEFVHLRRAPNLELERALPPSAALGVWTELEITLRQDGDQPVQVEFFEHPPSTFVFEGMPVRAGLAPNQLVKITYRVRPTERGEQRFLPAHARFDGKFGLIRRQIEVGTPETIRVLPNFKAVSRYALLAAADQVGRLGIRKLR
ncbi:MAG: hypothetical protein ACNA8W_19605, partial [Bradymonadaceae bacterium]